MRNTTILISFNIEFFFLNFFIISVFIINCNIYIFIFFDLNLFKKLCLI